jgi:hypothetical protein
MPLSSCAPAVAGLQLLLIPPAQQQCPAPPKIGVSQHHHDPGKTTASPAGITSLANRFLQLSCLTGVVIGVLSANCDGMIGAAAGKVYPRCRFRVCKAMLGLTSPSRCSSGAAVARKAGRLDWQQNCNCTVGACFAGLTVLLHCCNSSSACLCSTASSRSAHIGPFISKGTLASVSQLASCSKLDAFAKMHAYSCRELLHQPNNSARDYCGTVLLHWDPDHTCTDPCPGLLTPG